VNIDRRQEKRKVKTATRLGRIEEMKMSEETGWGMFEVALLFFFFVGILLLIALMYNLGDWIASLRNKARKKKSS
jgi:hypothetical protein